MLEPVNRAAPPHDRSLLVALGLAVTASLLAGCVDPPPEVRVAAAIVDVCSGVADGALCNDQNTCTTADRCEGGLCVGIPAVDGMACTDGNQCTRNDACNMGLCQGMPVVEGTQCTDGEPCTDLDACRMGRCMAGLPKICDDGIACTTDQCVTGTGCRSVVTAACPDGDAGAATDGGPGVDVLPPSDASDSGGPDRQDVDAGGMPDVGAGPDASDARDGTGGGDVTDAGDADDTDAADAAGDTDAADAAGDASDTDAAGDASLPDASAQLFEARGGACVCEIASARSPSTTLFGLGLAALVLTFRRRRS